VAVLSEALSFTFNHDDPENETAADILYNFGRDLEDYILISETASAHNVLSFKKHIQDLQELGFNVYAVVTNGTYKTQHTTVNNWKNAYIIVSKRDENSLIILPSL
jgi:Fe-S cluster assembly scaffold protein SufB